MGARGERGISAAPGAPAPAAVDRPRLRDRLSEAVSRRLTAVVAGPGCGKTTLLAGWARDHPGAWYAVTTADRDPLSFARGLVASLAPRVPGLSDDLGPALAGMRGPDGSADDVLAAFGPALAAGLHARLTADLVLIIDDVQELDGVPAAQRCVGDLCQLAPPRLHLVLASRGDLPVRTDRLRQDGELAWLSAQTLAFDHEETALLLAANGVDTALAPGVVAATGGWPAAVALLVAALAGRSDPDAVLGRLGGGPPGTAGTGERAGRDLVGGAADLIADLLEREVLPRAPADLARLLLVGAVVDSFTVGLLSHLGLRDAPATLDAARRYGSVVGSAAPDGWFRLTPMVREYVQRRLRGAGRASAPVPVGWLSAADAAPGAVAELQRAAAQWHQEHGDPGSALRYRTLAGDRAAILTSLERHGLELLGTGHSAVVVAALDAVPAAARTSALDLVAGEACLVRGDWDRAVTCLSRLVPPDGPAPAAAAWRLGLIHHLRGDLDAALHLYERGLADPAGAAGDLARCGAWGSAAAWLTGAVPRSRSLVTRAQQHLAGTGDHGAAAAVFTAQAMLAALDGDRRANDLHYARALDHAERAGDVLAQIRIRVNRGSRFLEEAAFSEAIEELDTAVRLSDLAGFAALRALALVNRGQAARWLGRLEDAERDFTAALTQARQLGSRIGGYALCGLGNVYADQGNPAQARAYYEQTVAVAEPAGDLQGLVPAWSGLAMLLASDDPGTAGGLVTRALRSDATLAHTAALLAAGWVAVAQDQPAAAGRYADRAAGLARQRHDRAGLAEAMELAAHAEADPVAAAALLRQAGARWEELGCPVPRARAGLALARRVGGAEGTRICDEAERDCRELGARHLVAQAAAVRAELARRATPQLSVQTLGGFRVLRHGDPVPHDEWPSARARFLLQRLIAARGRPVRADECDGEFGDLSGAAAQLRAVLDPQRRHPPGEYLVDGPDGLALRLDRVQVDVMTFLERAGRALAGAARSAGMAPGERLGPASVEALSAAEAAYTGDFCPGAPEQGWAAPLREEARAAYLELTRTLADHHAAVGDHDAAVRYLLRLLSCDPYHAAGHLALVRELDLAGRYGDSRTTYRDYAGRMDELGADPEPYPIHSQI